MSLSVIIKMALFIIQQRVEVIESFYKNGPSAKIHEIYGASEVLIKSIVEIF